MDIKIQNEKINPCTTNLNNYIQCDKIEETFGELGPLTLSEYNEKSYDIRVNSAEYEKIEPVEMSTCNSDENLYKNKIANFTKTMPHNKLGEVDMAAYNSYIKSLSTGNSQMFEKIILGGVKKLSNPQGAYTFDLIGANSHKYKIPLSPTFSSAWIASEMGEDYWMALTRDIPFSQYNTNETIAEACADMNRFSDFRGPKECHRVTPKTLFRGDTKGDLVGPYISQFLWKDIPYGAKSMSQQYKVPLAGKDFMTTYEEWLSIQNGNNPKDSIEMDSILKYISNGRDLSYWVYTDFLYEGGLNAALILLSYGKEALDSNNPYLESKTQSGFITFGAAHILDLVSKVARVALEAAWFQKFLVHRKLRPEEFAGRINNNLKGLTNYPINIEILYSKATYNVNAKYGTYLLPMAYPDGSPTHPAYPAGHATIIGACVTMLKAFFNEEFVIPNPVVASDDGLNLNEFKGEVLTLGGELNKLASNISLGRDMAGVHWRSDGIEGMNLGESIAISILMDFKKTYNEKFSGFSLTKFDGTKIII